MKRLKNGIILICLLYVFYLYAGVVGNYAIEGNKINETKARDETVSTENESIELSLESDLIECEVEDTISEEVSQDEEKDIPQQVVSHATPLYDFTEDIEKKHKILEYDICASPKYDYSATILAEYLKDDIEYEKEMSSKLEIKAKLKIDYHLFDFNDDGLEDYLVCLDGALFSGSGGNDTRIYIQEPDGSLRRILDISSRMHLAYYDEDGHAIHDRFTVLDEKTDGYYAIVLPGSNRILRYDKETGRYVFHEGE